MSAKIKAPIYKYKYSIIFVGRLGLVGGVNILSEGLAAEECV